MMQPLNLNERKEAIRLIVHQYYDSDVIDAVRELLQKKAAQRRGWQSFLNEHFPPSNVFNRDSVSDLGDTKPVTPIYDGD